MNWSQVSIVFRKELRDMLRDRRTIVGMVVIPLVVMPLMTAGFSSFERRSREDARRATASIVILGEEHAPTLAAELRASPQFAVRPRDENFRARIERKELRAAVEFSPGFESALQRGEPATATLYYFAAEMRSENAVTHLERLLRDYRQRIAVTRVAAAGLPPAALKPIETRRENVAAPQKVGASRLAIFLPYLIIVLTITGALHPALDLTAGEKERGTLETLLASAVGRTELVTGKFLLVLCASLTTTIMTLASYVTTVAFSKEYLKEVTGGHGFRIGPETILTIFVLVLPLAVFFASVLLALSLSAKSYKEGQQHLSPVLFLAFIPAIVGMLPGVELNAGLAVVPVLNVSLVAKEVLTGTFPWANIAIAFASTCVYAAIGLSAAVSQFRKESVLFSV